MSLQVWLPLTKDAINQGLCEGSLTTSGVTFTDGGKLGGKYLSDGTITIPAAVSKNIFNKTGMSFAFWLYPIGSSSSAVIMGQTAMSTGNNRMYTIYQYSTPNSLHLSWQDNTATNNATFLSGTWANFFPADTWTHCCVTYNGTQAIIYRNGIQYTTVNGVSNRTSFEYDYPIVGSALRKLQDVRIYNHCLSPMEVKELAKGLILHYPLNRNGWGQENLWRNSSCQENLNEMIQSTVKFNITTKDGYKCAHFSGVKGSSNATGYLAIPDTMLPEANAWYTISADMRIDNYSAGTTNPYVGIYFGGDYLNTDNTGGWYGGSSYSGDGKADNHTFVNTYNNKGWHRVSCTVQYLHGGAEYKKGAFRLGYIYARDFTGDLYVKNIKFEKGRIATPWCPNLEDTNNMGLNSTAEYDISGYCNNGTRIGTLTWSSDTPKYNVSTEFNGTDSTIDCGNGFHTQGARELTWSCWVYSNSWDDGVYKYFMSSQESGGIILAALSSSNNIRARVHAYTAEDLSTSGYIQADCTYGSSGITTEGWHMLTGVYTTSNIKLYIDGELKKTTTTTTYGIHFNNTAHMFLGAESAGTTYSNLCACKLSDCRVYATALSASDVKSLYQNCATIDPDGTIRGQIRI